MPKNMKKSFVLYADTFETLKYLPDDKLGRITRMMYEFVIYGTFPDASDELFFVFNPIKIQMERDLDKYEIIREKRSKAGKASVEQKQHMLTHVESVKQINQVYPVSVNVNDSVSVSDNVNEIQKKGLIKNPSSRALTIKEYKDYIEDNKLLKDEEILNTFLEFIEMRIKIKKPPTEKSINLSIKKLRELSGDKKNIAIKIIENSIEANWQTFYPLKDINNKTNQPTFTRASQGVKMT